MTDEIFSRDAYQASADATVTEVRDDGVVLDRTVFYARGGGQPGDTGTLRWDGGEARVADTVKASGEVLHVLEEGATPPPAGTAVTAEIDWARRHTLMRTHTALHALSGIVFTDYGARVTGGNMEPGVARMDFELDGDHPGVRPRGRAEAERRAPERPPGPRELRPARAGARRPRSDPHEGQPDPRSCGPDPRDRHRGSGQAGGRRHPRPLDRRGRSRPRGQDRVEGQGQQAHADRTGGRHEHTT